MTDKDLIKKLLKIAGNQQKIITKLAQAIETDEQKKARWAAEKSQLSMDGTFTVGKLSEDNPYRYDPLYAGEGSKNTSNIAGAPANTPAAVVENRQVKQMAPASSGVTAQLASLLQSGAPGLKGLVQVKANGKFLDVSYNADAVRNKLKLSANDVKRILTNAVGPAYQISNVVGLTNPDATFVPNWS